MKAIKTILTTFLVFGFLLLGCGCGSGNEQGEMLSNAEPEVPATSYTVTVVDQDNQPIPGVLLQLCLESCIPNKTNDNGIAEFTSLPDGDYKVSLLSIPDGYEYATEEREWYFPEGERVLTVVLSKAP